DTVLGFDAFNPGRNFQDAGTSLRHQNGIVFFPGSTPLYRNGTLIGGLGVSGDGVDQDDVVTFLAAQDFLPRQNGVLSADDVSVDGVRLPFIKLNRVPFG
ncbi:MAG: heme-binding protein, partial [Planctomycetaceae bacterium]